jgi:hypothetical protein
MQCSVNCCGKSVRPLHSRALAKTAPATVVIKSSIESLFHLVSGKLKLVTEGHP